MSGQLLTPPAAAAGPSQRRMFLTLRRRLFANSLRTLLQRSRLRLALILFLSLLIWGGLFGLFSEGFQFLRNLQTAAPISAQIIELLFGMFFLSLTALTVFSTGLLLYGSLFRAPDAWYLLSTPARPEQIFAYKFHEALLFSGWSFLLLGTPLLLAYGLVMGATWPFFVLFVPFLVGFLVLPGSWGALACLLIVHYLPRRRKQVLITLVLAVIVGLGWWAASVASGARMDSVSEEWLRKFLGHLRPAQLPFLPSRWMTRGLMAAAHDEPGDALFYLLLIWSNGLFFFLLCGLAARRLYRSAYNRVASTGGANRKYGLHWSDRLISRLIGWTDRRTRVFVVKDLRTFRRDPVQWAQVLILFLVLLLYFVNIPRLPHGHYALYQRTLIGLLNVGVIGLMLATYTSRFIFPMMSLEGRNFWILGLLPLDRDHLLWSKFAYAATVTVTGSVTLALVSEVMLNLPWPVVLIHGLTMFVLALGLSALSVGLGTYLINLKESNPSKIATGFGGTINLLVSLAFAVVSIALAGVPTFLYFARDDTRAAETIVLADIRWWFAASLALVLACGALAVALPLRLGMRAFRRMEF
jgi:ABC-2 type transport system permease protein